MENSCVYQTLQTKFSASAIAIALCTVSIAPAEATTLVPSQTFKAGTKLACVVDQTMSSATLQYGDKFHLRVVDTSQPALAGSEVVGYIAEVTQPSGMNRAKVSFFLTSIHLRNGTKKSISAYVVNKGVTPYNPAAIQQYRQHMAAAPPMPNGVVTPGPVAWQMKIGSSGPATISTRPGGLLGGTVYAAGPHEPIVVAAGTPVTIELQQPLTIP